MRTLTLSSQTRSFLLLLAGLGIVVPNGVFLWCLFADFDLVLAALRNPVALVFIAEAFLVMGLLAWLARRSGRGPGAGAFIVMSLLGSLAFSVPAWLWLASREKPS